MRKLSIFLLISLFVIGVQGATVAQETNEQEPALESVSESLNDAQEAPPQEQEANVLEASKPAKIITAVEITGNKSISTNTILSKMKARVGDPYLENVISDDLKRLYLLGFFSDINIDTQDYKDGLKVVVAVVERPIIEKVTFSGMTRITMKDEKLKGMLKTKEGQYLDYPNLTEDVQTLKGMYEKKGFGAVDIQYTVATDEATQKTTVQFVVQEGKRIRIKRITVAGNEHFSDKRIIKLMKTRPAWLFNAGVLKEDVLEEDMERIRSFYHKQGFTDVVVNYNVTSDARKPFLYITVSVEEGKKYLVGNVVIEGNKDISLKELLAKVKECAPGDVFSQEGMQQDIVAISGLYFDRGYIMATVDETTSLNAYTSRVDIKYTITENTIAFVDKIKIRGNIKTKDVVIRRELRIKPGDKFDGEKLRRSKERLQNLGFFEDVSYDTEDTQVSDKKDLVVDVKESKTGAFSFGGGYSTIEQFVGFIEIEQKNFDWKNIPYFTGDGQNLKLRASFGTLSNSYLLSFTEPWFFDYPVSFGFDAYRR
ncbi:MAG: outer membrane protein assembly factor BamA, partial [Candidatus Omnitrophica bacterium]|nr:outer membrane protein assembly factor BamA [Candidatus Omnitrophota bacterium]